MEQLYDMILKRKSVRRFDRSLHISNEELDDIKLKISNLKPLVNDIEIAYKIVKVEDTNCKWNGEYCILVYSQEKENYLLNIGYMFEQLDLYLASLNIGACWYGWGKTSEKIYDNKKFVIMINFGKSKVEDFRENIEKTNRKEINEMWEGNTALEVASVARYAPSACNSQPWIVKSHDNTIDLYQNTNITSILSKALIRYFNIIDLGIFMLILELSLNHFEYDIKRELMSQETKISPNQIASYTIKKL